MKPYRDEKSTEELKNEALAIIDRVFSFTDNPAEILLIITTISKYCIEVMPGPLKEQLGPEIQLGMYFSHKNLETLLECLKQFRIEQRKQDPERN